jgi:hypothetical protein
MYLIVEDAVRKSFLKKTEVKESFNTSLLEKKKEKIIIILVAPYATWAVETHSPTRMQRAYLLLRHRRDDIAVTSTKSGFHCRRRRRRAARLFLVYCGQDGEAADRPGIPDRTRGKWKTPMHGTRR